MSSVYLGLDTCTPYLSLALWTPRSGTLASRAELVERGHAARLVIALEEMLDEAGVGRDSLAGIAVGNGPGSYTGLRVGGASGRGLARALGIPLAGCDTLAAIAFGALASGAEGLAAVDARRGNIYVGRYRREGDTLVTQESPHKVAREQAQTLHPGLELIEGVAPDPVYIARQAAGATPYRPLYL
ncbi:MAG: tRNA (adenosine(37)-N6)-threonylcarbamoyltransferase complex dimerization subunit type 1 TsaB [Trueperaceae bacterium]